MAKDYFQDIVPPADEPNSEDHFDPQSASAGAPADAPNKIPINTGSTAMGTSDAPPERSIRNIAPPRPRMTDMRSAPAAPGIRPSRKLSKWWIWLLAGVAVLALAALALMALRTTSVSVTPRTHALTFGPEITFMAYPSDSASAAVLSYSVTSSDLEDSEVVPTQGTVHSEDKASGNITVYNNYQTTPLKLVKSTRFETSSGLVFRTPADVVVPAKKGGTPGQVSITVVADKAGAEYNVAATKFTLPGLKSNPQMYAGVYAQSSDAMSGGFVGDKPGMAPGAEEKALSTVRARIESKARASLPPAEDGKVVIADLVQIAYSEGPQTTEAGGGVRIHEKAHITVPIFDESAFAREVGRSAIGDSDAASVSFIPGKEFGARATATSTKLGSDPLSFTLSGNATIVWKVDSAALAQALAGHERSAFEGIVKGFAGLEQARARIQPFWKTAFPTDPSAIKITVETPAEAK